jgi:hypothetical protein
MSEAWTWEPAIERPRTSAGVYAGTKLIACVMKDDDAARIAGDHRLVPLLMAERDEARRLIQASYDRLVGHWGNDGSTLKDDVEYQPELNLIRDMYRWLRSLS